MARELILFILNICVLCFFNLLISQQAKIAGIILWVFFRDFSFRLTVTTDSKSAMFRYKFYYFIFSIKKFGMQNLKINQTSLNILKILHLHI